MPHFEQNNNNRWALGGFIGIFVIILILFLLIPAVWKDPLVHLLAHSSLTIVVVYTLFVITKASYVLWIGVPLSLLFIFFDIYSVYTSSMEAVYIAYSIYALLLVFAIVVSIRKVLLTKKINTNLICGAIIVYLFFGILWAKLYFLADGLIPASFNGIKKADPGSSDLIAVYNTQFEFIYYSFTTLATVGVGDILPLNRLTKSLTMLEAMFGQLYVATVIAKLVSVWHKSTYDDGN